MSTVLLVALIALAAAVVWDIAVGVRLTWGKSLPYLLGAASSVLFVVVGAAGLAGHRVWLGLDTLLGGEPTGLQVDQLSGLFLVLCFGVAAPVCLSCAAWSVRPGRVEDLGLSAAFALTLGAVAVVLTAVDVFYFLFAWECVTLGFYLMTAWRRPGNTASPAILTAVLGKASGAALLVGMTLLAAQAGSLSLDAFGSVPAGVVPDLGWLLLVTGFAVKVGLIPVHIWLPRSYRAAPGPIRAIMAGVAVNIGFYGLWRILDVLPPPPGWLGAAVVIIGGCTALLGIAHVAVRNDLTEVIAYSSVENAGLISVGFGIAMIGTVLHLDQLVAVGLLAATLQAVTHALAKSLLFVSAAGIEDAAGSSDLDELRGIGHRLPISGTGLAMGSLAMAGLPLTVGFVSEWFLLEALMQQFRLGNLGYQIPLAIAGALVALTTGFAGLAFVRIVGLTVLGPRSSGESAVGRDVGPAGTVGIAVLALGIVGVAAVAPLEVRVIAAGVSPVVPTAVTGSALRSPWVLQPVYPEFSILSPSWLAIVLPALTIGVVGLGFLFGRGRFTAVRRVPAWRSASAGAAGENQYKPSAFANPTRRILSSVLRTRSELRGPAPGTAHAGGEADGDSIGYSTDVIEVVEHLVYRPLLRPLRVVVRQARRLQNGRLDAYLTYMLIVVIAVIAIVAAIG